FLREDETEAARFTYNSSRLGTLTVPEGGTATYEVKVITGTGDIVDINGIEYSLDDVRVINPSVATVSAQGVDEVVFSGVLGGSTTLQFWLKHGAHTEFEVKEIPVAVLGQT